MATTCKPMGALRFDDLFSGRLQTHGVYEHIIENKSTASRKSLTEGRNTVWVVGQPGGLVSELILKGTNDPKIIFEAIFAEFQVKIAREYEPEFWGFQSHQDWYRGRLLQQNEGFYERLLERLVFDHGSEVEPKRHSVPSDAASVDPIELLKMDMARKFINQDRTLLTPTKKNELIIKIIEQLAEVHEALDRELRAPRQVMHRDWSIQEEREEGPVPPAGLIFEINREGVVIARARPGAREAERAERRRADLDDEIPF